MKDEKEEKEYLDTIVKKVEFITKVIIAIGIIAFTCGIITLWFPACIIGILLIWGSSLVMFGIYDWCTAKRWERIGKKLEELEKYAMSDSQLEIKNEEGYEPN